MKHEIIILSFMLSYIIWSLITYKLINKTNKKVKDKLTNRQITFFSFCPVMNLWSFSIALLFVLTDWLELDI